MNNIYENNEHVVDNTEDLSELHLEKMRYNNNSLSYILGLLGIVFSIAACFISLNSLNPVGFKTVIKVVLNIVVLLIGFLAAEKVKVYQKKFSYVNFALGGIAILRMFWYPLTLLINYNGFKSMLITQNGLIDKLSYETAGAAYKDVLGVTLIGKFNVVQEVVVSEEEIIYLGEIAKTGYFTTNGYIRAIVLFVLLGCCAACFIFSGLINLVKSTKLNNYLAKHNAKN